jgi:hypothetical protein
LSPELGVLVGFALALVAAIVVTRPLLRAPPDALIDETGLSDLVARREAAYQVLRDLDSDFQIGKLAEDDYRQMRVQSLAQAAEIVAQLDAYHAPPPKAEAIQPTRVQRRKRRHPVPPAGFCPSCGTAHEEGDVFCRKCGKALG